MRGADCTICEPGRFVAEAASAGPCDICEAGKYAPTYATAECMSCEAGSYLADSGTNVTMHDEATDCSVCSAGTYMTEAASAGPCDECLAGRALHDPGTDASEHNSEADCITCGRGFYADSTGMANCSACGAGKFMYPSEVTGDRDNERQRDRVRQTEPRTCSHSLRATSCLQRQRQERER